jgi:protein-S-isoprenylcysteine O-methyltransferase Ste14
MPLRRRGEASTRWSVGARRRETDMRDLPLLILALAVSLYWAGVARMVVRVQRKTRHGVGLVPQQSRERLMWLVWLPLVVAWIALPWVALDRTEGPWTVPPPFGPAYGGLRFAAALLAIGCLALTWRCYGRMGEHWRMDVAVEARSVLITDGPFLRIRHPIYAYQALLMVCSAVVLPTVPMIALAVIHLALVNAKARNEERHLLATHGEAYARYVERTGRFVPRFGARES